MKAPLIHRLQMGLPMSFPRLVRQQPSEAIVRLRSVVADMKDASEALVKAEQIISAFAGKNTTFGDHERAIVWLKHLHQLP